MLIINGQFEKVAKNISAKEAKEINADGLHITLSVIDDQYGSKKIAKAGDVQ